MPLPVSGVQGCLAQGAEQLAALEEGGCAELEAEISTVPVLRTAGPKKARAKHRKPTFQLSPPTAGLDACCRLIASSHHVAPGSGALGSPSWLARLATKNVAAHDVLVADEEQGADGWGVAGLPQGSPSHGKHAGLGAARSPKRQLPGLLEGLRARSCGRRAAGACGSWRPAPRAPSRSREGMRPAEKSRSPTPLRDRPPGWQPREGAAASGKRREEPCPAWRDSGRRGWAGPPGLGHRGGAQPRAAGGPEGHPGAPALGASRATCPTPCAHGMAAASRGSCWAPTPQPAPQSPVGGTALPGAAAQQHGGETSPPLPQLTGPFSSQRDGRRERSVPSCSRGPWQQWGHPGTPSPAVGSPWDPLASPTARLCRCCHRTRCGPRLGFPSLPWGSAPQQPLEGVRKHLENSPQHPPVPQREGTPLWQPVGRLSFGNSPGSSISPGLSVIPTLSLDPLLVPPLLVGPNPGLSPGLTQNEKRCPEVSLATFTAVYLWHALSCACLGC